MSSCSFDFSFFIQHSDTVYSSFVLIKKKHFLKLKKDNDLHSFSFSSVSLADKILSFPKHCVFLSKSLLGLVSTAAPSVKILLPVLSVS